MKKCFLGLIVLACLFTFSCKKDCPAPTYSIEGLWIGSYNYASTSGTHTTQVPQYFSFIIKPEGSLIVESQDAGVSYMATGTWTLSGDTLNCKYIYPTSVVGTQLYQVATSTFEKSGKLSNGVWYNTYSSWEQIPDPNQQGTFTMERVD